MLKASRSIELWLESQIRSANRDLLERVLARGTDLELQVNVSPNGGEQVARKFSTYTDGTDEWFSFRIPKGARGEPHWKDFPLPYNLSQRVEAIGCTGWNWKRRASEWVGFDFDSVVGHAPGVGVSSEKLDEIRRAVESLPYVELRKSTSGLGFHLYVHLENVPCENHTVHAAIARCVLAKMSDQLSVDLLQHVDVCGSNLWVAARRATDENDGLALIKPAECKFHELPDDWRSHIEVVNRSRPRISVPGVDKNEEGGFTQLTSSNPRVVLSEGHKSVRARLEQLGCSNWVQDHFLLQTHTCLLRQVHAEMKLKGVFETSSKGTRTSEPNCFCFPMPNGAWKVVRFGQGTSEHRSWTQDGKGWTTCYLNREPTFEVAALAIGGKLLPCGGYEFNSLKEVERVLEALAPEKAIEIEAHESLLDRTAVVKLTKNNELMIEIEREKRDPELQNWSGKPKRNHWTQIVPIKTEIVGRRSCDFDDTVRCLQSSSGDPEGWAVLIEDGTWSQKTASSVRNVFQRKGSTKSVADIQMGAAELNPWTVVTIPFAPEYPGDRRWNRESPQLAFKPQEPDDDGTESAHPHWDMILEHVGRSLNDALSSEPWAQDAGVLTGQQYLQCWFASIIREPFEPLPYLFAFGPENSGKSILHEAFSLLVTSGVVKADRSLVSTSEFNGELEGCILAVVEEKNISATPGAHNRIKDAVTSRTLSIRRMRSDSYEVQNSSHWIQCANDPGYCPVFPGDTRITMLNVLPIEKEIAKPLLRKSLIDEAPFFLWSLLHTPLPRSQGRLRIPVVNTQFKDEVASMNKSNFEAFLDECCILQPGGRVLYSDFLRKLNEWVPAGEKYNRHTLSKELRRHEHVKSVTRGQRVSYIEGVIFAENASTSKDLHFAGSCGET